MHTSRRISRSTRPGQARASAFYGVQPSPSMIRSGPGDGCGLSRMDHLANPALVAGSNPSQTALTEFTCRRTKDTFARHRPRSQRCGLDLAFERTSRKLRRRRMQGPLNGRPPQPEKQCRKAGRCINTRDRSQGVTDPGSANNAYYVWVDRYHVRLGPNVPIDHDERW